MPSLLDSAVFSSGFLQASFAAMMFAAAAGDRALSISLSRRHHLYGAL
jgi:hypothetical protein